VGSFCELVLAVNLRPDVPDEVLAAFVSARKGEGGPELPAPVPDDPHWEPDDPEASPAADAAPWAHPWGDVLGMDMSGVAFPGETGVSLIWNKYTERWALTVRSVWKTMTPGVVEMIEWLGPFVDPMESLHDRRFVGYVYHQYDERPTLIWHDGESFELDGQDYASS
jgi:hypothetical protein